MKLLLIAALALSSALALPRGQNRTDPRIVDGQEAQRGQFPYAVSLQYVGYHRCGAAIISPTFAVTAAHCVYGGMQNLFAAAGLLDQGENHQENQVVLVSEVIPHPRFDGVANDIALLRLEKPLAFNEAVGPISLPEAGDEFSGQTVFPGWGRVSVVPSLYPKRLQFLEMPIITVDECNERFSQIGSFPFKVEEGEICTLPNRPRQSTCHGDSGGPLVQNGKFIGILFGGDNYCGSGLSVEAPNVFTKVGPFLGFIKEHVTDL